MKNFVMLTESELDQVSGGGDTFLEELQSGFARAVGDKVMVGLAVALLTPTLMMFGKHISDAIENFFFRKPEAKEKSSEKSQEKKADPAALKA
ncbi:MAG: hypothetical protein ACI4PJ_01815 [Acutalibacteraceae bacterium]